MKKEKCFDEKTEKIKVTYKNLFGEDCWIDISREYFDRTVKFFEEAFNNIEEKIKNSALKMFNFCEFFKGKDDWIKKIETENRLERIPFLSVDDIEYFHSKGITKIKEMEDKSILEKIYEDLPEGLKDKYDDIQEWLKNKDEKIPTCNHKYYLNWSEYNQINTGDEKEALEAKYAVNFEGHSDTDIVYAFSYQPMYLKGAEKKHIILEKSEKSKEVVLEHYRKIVNEIYGLLKEAQEQKKDIIFVTLAPYAGKNFEKVIETILEYKSMYEQETINNTLNVAEYFGFNYYLEGEAITYINPYVDTWIDLKNVIEKYICTGISVVNSFTEVYEKLCDKKLDSNSLNSHNYSWALKPKYIKEMWRSKKEKAQNSQENLTADLKKQLDMKLSDINKMHSALYPKKRLLQDIMICPKKRNFTNDGSFISRFMLKETISSIKEYKQGLADYSFNRLIEKGLILELTNVEFKNKGSYKDNGRKRTKPKYYYTFDYDEKSDFDNSGMIEYFYKKENFKEVLERSFDFDNLLDLDFDNKLLVRKDDELKIENKTLYVIKSIFDTVEDKTTIINNTEKVLQNLKENNIDKLNMKSDKDFYFESKLEGKQKEVLQSIIANKFTLLLGPPGTGKTYTIAKVVNELSKEYPDKKFLITGFTNLSIENCLFKIINEGKGKQKIGKWKEVKDKKYIEKIDIINSIDQLANKDVLGSTIYQFSKFKQKFDYIIVDEASQMKISEFLMTYQVAKEDTHFLIVGDDNQLPPIIKNKYLNSDKKEILEAKSIFSYISAKHHDCIIRLNDCYRMNGVLCEYPEDKIYKGFKPAKKEIENQKLALSEKCTDNVCDKEYLFKILDSDCPVVLCLVDNKGVKGNSSEIEAQLCAEISWELYKLYNNLKNKNNSENNSFWGKYLAIVSPHHAHIRQIKNELSKKFNDGKENEGVKKFFVDTVDKMQGQEADAIIVSYGVTDSQIAFREKEFIYNRNRLNVSITRAKSKLVVILSKELLDIDRRLLDDMELKGHIDFMTEYIEYLIGEDEKNKILEEKRFILYGIPFKIVDDGKSGSEF